ncbi:MAG: hypothetical protein MZV65_33895 [Chromatiales bacterium]|nr:hypothetical protein [Chromatiales bacterium]
MDAVSTSRPRRCSSSKRRPVDRRPSTPDYHLGVDGISLLLILLTSVHHACWW